MKKALPLLALLLVLAAVIAFTRRRAGGLSEKFPASRAAELAPRETIAYLELPDLDRMRARWREQEAGAPNETTSTAAQWRLTLHGILDRLVAESRFNLSGASESQAEFMALFSILAEAENVDPGGLFVAAADSQGAPLPRMIAGLPFRGKRTEVETAVRGAKEKLFKRWPGSKSELSTHSGIELETITSPTELLPQWVSQLPGVTFPPKAGGVPRNPRSNGASALPSVQLAFRDDWLFFATDRALLEGTLDRYLRRSEAPSSLAQNPIFAECRKHGAAEADVVAWTHWDPLGKAVAERLTGFSLPDEKVAKNPLQAILYTGVLGLQPRDRVYFHLTKAPVSPPLANRSVGLTTAWTQGYAALNFNGLAGDGEWIRKQFWSFQGHMFVTEWTGPEFQELRQGFGPEMAFFVQTEPRGLQWVVALEVRDVAKARELTDRIAWEKNAQPQVEGETILWEWTPSSRRTFMSPMALTKTHLIFGTSREAALAVADRSKAGAGTLQADPAYAEAMREAGAPNGMVLYFDLPKYFAQRKGSATAALQAGYEDFDPAPSPAPTPSSMSYVGGRITTGRTRFPTSAGSRPALRDATSRGVGTAPPRPFGSQLRPGTVTLRTEGPGWLAESTLGVPGNLALLSWLRSDALMGRPSISPGSRP